MAQYTADEQGKVWITLSRDSTQLRFAIGAMDGVPFTPGGRVEIDDTTLREVVGIIAGPFGLGTLEDQGDGEDRRLDAA